jgi:hypothetical protein
LFNFLKSIGKNKEFKQLEIGRLIAIGVVVKIPQSRCNKAAELQRKTRPRGVNCEFIAKGALGGLPKN